MSDSPAEKEIRLKQLEEFKNLCPALLTDERIQLEENLKKDGCLSPLVVWGEILIDGHNRYEICTRLNIPFQTVQKSFEIWNDAIEWIIQNQFGRRNLSTSGHDYLQGRLYEIEKKKVGSVNQYTSANDQSDHKQTTADVVAKKTGSSPATVRRNAKFSQAVDILGNHAEVMAGTETRNKTEIIAAAFPKSEEPQVEVTNELNSKDKLPKIVWNEAMGIAATATSHLECINKNDISREKAFLNVIRYCIGGLFKKTEVRARVRIMESLTAIITEAGR